MLRLNRWCIYIYIYIHCFLITFKQFPYISPNSSFSPHFACHNFMCDTCSASSVILLALINPVHLAFIMNYAAAAATFSYFLSFAIIIKPAGNLCVSFFSWLLSQRSSVNCLSTRCASTHGVACSCYCSVWLTTLLAAGFGFCVFLFIFFMRASRCFLLVA